MKKILIVVGTRPNFIKITRFKEVFESDSLFDIKIVHTGQHYDSKMADVFFKSFNLEPDYFLNIGDGTPNTQMANIMLGLEKIISEYYPDLVIVPGDVNSTLAAALAANKMNIKLAHLESGLRSFDRTMPEEINRILVDEISDYYFVTEQSGINNLLSEGKKARQIYFVGNTMIDTLVHFGEEIKSSEITSLLKLQNEDFVLMTMHRPATVDVKEGLLKLISLIDEITTSYKLVFPVHYRTRKKLTEFGLEEKLITNKNLLFVEPLDYFSFQKLILNCKLIITDSGGIQEESTFRGKPCITLRTSTERPSTTEIGTNILVDFDIEVIRNTISEIENGTFKKGNIPALWDGKSTERILKICSRLVV